MAALGSCAATRASGISPVAAWPGHVYTHMQADEAADPSVRTRRRREAVSGTDVSTLWKPGGSRPENIPGRSFDQTLLTCHWQSVMPFSSAVCRRPACYHHSVCVPVRVCVSGSLPCPPQARFTHRRVAPPLTCLSPSPTSCSHGAPPPPPPPPAAGQWLRVCVCVYHRWGTVSVVATVEVPAALCALPQVRRGCAVRPAIRHIRGELHG